MTIKNILLLLALSIGLMASAQIQLNVKATTGITIDPFSPNNNHINEFNSFYLNPSIIGESGLKAIWKEKLFGELSYSIYHFNGIHEYVSPISTLNTPSRREFTSHSLSIGLGRYFTILKQKGFFSKLSYVVTKQNHHKPTQEFALHDTSGDYIIPSFGYTFSKFGLNFDVEISALEFEATTKYLGGRIEYLTKIGLNIPIIQ